MGELSRTRPPAARAWALMALALVAAAACAAYARGELIDDAFISFRYAGNLLAGQGLVFNPGERVEGYTNFLWVLLIAATKWLGASPELSSRLLGGMFGVATVVVVGRMLPAVPGRPLWSTSIAPALLAFNCAASLWAVHGLETALFTFLVTAGMALDIRAAGSGRATWMPAVCFALATLARPEGVLFLLASVTHGAVFSRRRWLSVRNAAGIATYVVIVGTFWAWRWSYYGWPLPNTFYAKVGFTGSALPRGLAYLGSFFLDARSIVFLFLVPAAVAAWRARRGALAARGTLADGTEGRQRPGRALAASEGPGDDGAPRGGSSPGYLLWMSAVYLCGVVFEGGDAFPAFRFIVPVLPPLYVLVQEGAFAVASAARTRGAGRKWGPVLGAALIACGLLHAQHMFSEAGKEREGADRFTSRMRAVGLALRDNVPPTTTIALNPAGAVPYYSGLRAFDMLGLVNEHIAHTSPTGLGAGKAGHEKGDGAYILGLRPDLILLGNVRVVGERPADLSRVSWAVAYRSERELARQPDFLRLYAPDAIPLGDGRHLLFMRRRDFEIPGGPGFLARP